MTAPFNLALHEHALSLGYSHVRIDADWEDVGNGETGPMPRGHNGYDEYCGPDEVLYATADGVLDREAIYRCERCGWELPRFDCPHDCNGVGLKKEAAA